jgi:class 3 adenylate cyclase
VYSNDQGIFRMPRCVWAILTVLLWQPVLAAQEMLRDFTTKFSTVWELHEGEPLEWSQNPLLVDPLSLEDWLPYSSSLVPFGINRTIWLRNRLPTTIEPHSALFFRAGLEDLAVYVGFKRVYQYGRFDRSWGHVTSQMWHSIPLRPEYAGQVVSIRLHYAYSFITKTLYPDIKHANEAYKEPIRSGMARVFLIGLLVFAGFSSLAVALSRRSVDVFFTFGLLCCCATVWLAFNQDSTLKDLLGVPPELWIQLDLLAIFATSPLLMQFIAGVFRLEGKQKMWLLRPIQIVGLIGIVLLLQDYIHPLYFTPVLNLVLFFSCLGSLPIILRAVHGPAQDSKALAWGCTVLILTVVHSTFQFQGILPKHWTDLLVFGIAAFFVSTIVALVFRYRREHQDAAAVREQLLADVHKLNRDLEAQVRRIDALVEEKTRDIRSIMQHIEIGICMVQTSDLKVAKDYTSYLERLLEVKHLAGRDIRSLLFREGAMNAHEVQLGRSTLEVLSQCSIEDFDFHEPTLPHQIMIPKSDGQLKEIELSWHAIGEAKGDIEKLLITFSDMTVLRKLERATREKATELERLNTYISQRVLQRFFPPDLVQDLIEGRAAFDDQAESRLITVLFADLCDFTSATEELGPTRIASILNSYFITMTDIIFAAGGTIDKFMGDGILIFFGAPRAMEATEQVRRACECALQMQAALREMNKGWDLHEFKPFEIRIGIHHGPAIVGSFGGSKRSDYTAIGSTVNIASRVEQAAKPGQILISPIVRRHLTGYRSDSAGYFRLRGVREEVELFVLEGLEEAVTASA